MNRLAFALVAALGLSSVALAGPQVAFNGEFSQVSVTGGGPCAEVFAVRDYRASHFLVGPTNRTSVIHFRTLDSARSSDDNAFFDGMSFIGLYGYSGDVYVDKEVETRDANWDLHLEGIVDYSLIFVEITARATLADGSTCTARAEFSGFNN